MPRLIPLDEAPLNYIETQDDATEFLNWLGERRPVLCCDTETTGLRWWLPSFRIRLIQFGDACSGWVMRADRFGALAEKVLSSYNTSRITGHNFRSFDYHALRSQGFSFPDARLVDDTLMMSKIAQANLYDHSLKGQGRIHFGRAAVFGQSMLDEAFEAHGFRVGRGATTEQNEEAWTNIPYEAEDYVIYSGFDTVLGARLWEKLNPIIQSEYPEAYAREMGAWDVTAKREHAGVRVDLEHVNKMHDEISHQIDIRRTQLSELGLPNPGSRQKLAQKLLDDGWEPREFNKKSGSPSTKKAVIEGLNYDIIEPLMEWNRLTKWRSAYVEAVIKSAYNGRVYPSINAMGAKTGRESAYGPPIHQIPARHEDSWKIRKMFLPEEGEMCVSIDYNAQENRLLAHFSGDELLTDIIMTGKDIHYYNAAAIFEKSVEGVTHEERATAKQFSYAAGYGAQDLKLSSVLGVDVTDMPAIRQRVNGMFHGVADYSERLVESVTRQYNAEGSAFVTTWGGRRVYIDTKKDKYGKRRLQTTQVVNAPNQGSGADIAKEAKNRLAAAGLDQHLMFWLHDEGLYSVPAGPEGDELAREIGKIMEFTDGEFKIPMTTSVGEQTPYWSGH